MRDSVPSASYSSVCNVLRQWNISLIPTYRVYRLYATGSPFNVVYSADRPLDELAGTLLWYIIESVDSISRDERDVPLTQYITNA